MTTDLRAQLIAEATDDIMRQGRAAFGVPDAQYKYILFRLNELLDAALGALRPQQETPVIRCRETVALWTDGPRVQCQLPKGHQQNHLAEEYKAHGCSIQWPLALPEVEALKTLEQKKVAAEETDSLLQVLRDAWDIRSACGWMWMRMALAKDAQDAYDVAKRDFSAHEAAFKRLETSLPHLIEQLEAMSASLLPEGSAQPSEKRRWTEVLCMRCGGNGTIKIPGGVSVCPHCDGRCFEPEGSAQPQEKVGEPEQP